uniref:SFR19-like C-terminal domain-containing protein n=1 Tax=Glossina pallidipes TaxID=7398 RepID=A0A1A9ZVL9_GLOPL
MFGDIRLLENPFSGTNYFQLGDCQLGELKEQVTDAVGLAAIYPLKIGKSDDLIKVYDDVPNSAVELQVKDKITKEDYKEIMRRAVPKICHSKSGEIDPHKIKNLIDAYVKKFRAKHKKLNLANTGQVADKPAITFLN